jgi:hypothetical protein
MTRVTLDAVTWARLKGLREDAELYDDSGRLVGYFRPGPPRDENGKLIVPFTDEEVESLSNQRGGRPLKDILDDLSKK